MEIKFWILVESSKRCSISVGKELSKNFKGKHIIFCKRLLKYEIVTVEFIFNKIIELRLLKSKFPIKNVNWAINNVVITFTLPLRTPLSIKFLYNRGIYQLHIQERRINSNTIDILNLFLIVLIQTSWTTLNHVEVGLGCINS